ncbi:MAG: DegT/DnrJ/EryC1/StrS family aminotransferase [Dysgonamonadaceae bacterium]|nr:DegT/DnrJ/EryC1/StrS family aminotransferase [Dysgonamonadaceae bacterium]MDD4727357.1 DegT/DnrJ/EryC1/StrS family aminotransferase [Dysgonamonadaceae bacterium]
MKSNEISRRRFIGTLAAATTGVVASGITPVFANSLDTTDKPAILGGTPVRGSKKWLQWPQWDAEKFNPKMNEVMGNRVWSRSKNVAEFEKKWSGMHGTKHCLTTVNGTNALSAAWMQLDIGPGDEIICSPYTFSASIFGILYKGAMPVFADIDPETFQIDPKQIEKKITPKTKGILPVHICGYPSDMPTIMKIAKKHNLYVVEDACQAHLAEIGGKKVGTFGNAGCFSFQASKNLPIGEGGAILTNDTEYYDRLYSYHNFGYASGSVSGQISSISALILANKIRMAEYQAVIGLCQMEKLEEQHKKRNENGAYLNEKLAAYPGVTPVKLHKGATSASYYIYAMVYNQDKLDGLPRQRFIDAIRAEGVPMATGYPNDPLYAQPMISEVFKSDFYKNSYTAGELDFEKYKEDNHCPELIKTYNSSLWMWQGGLMLGSKSDMDDIINAFDKVHNNVAKLK